MLHRRSIRLPGHDYRSAGAYYITLTAHNRERLFAELHNGQMRLTLPGQVVQRAWQNMPVHLEQPDTFIVMPDHVHAIVWLDGEHETVQEKSGWQGTTSMSLGALVQNFKSITTRKIKATQMVASGAVWQRNYYERIIRDEIELFAIRAYIKQNPARWIAKINLH